METSTTRTVAAKASTASTTLTLLMQLVSHWPATFDTADVALLHFEASVEAVVEPPRGDKHHLLLTVRLELLLLVLAPSVGGEVKRKGKKRKGKAASQNQRLFVCAAQIGCCCASLILEVSETDGGMTEVEMIRRCNYPCGSPSHQPQCIPATLFFAG